MHLQESLIADAVAHFDVYSGEGAWRRQADAHLWTSPEYKNLIVTGGKNLVLDRLFGLGTAAAVSAVGVGTDATAAAVGQTQLNPSVAGTVLLQAADAGTARVGQTVTMTATFGTGVANFTWNECGLFAGTTNGTSVMFDRINIGPFAKTAAVSIVLSIALTQA